VAGEPPEGRSWVRGARGACPRLQEVLDAQASPPGTHTGAGSVLNAQFVSHVLGGGAGQHAKGRLEGEARGKYLYTFAP